MRAIILVKNRAKICFKPILAKLFFFLTNFFAFSAKRRNRAKTRFLEKLQIKEIEHGFFSDSKLLYIV